MKKSILAFALVGILTVGGGSLAFAHGFEQTYGNRENGTTAVQCLVDGGLSYKETKVQTLEEKFAIVDTAVENGVITAERAVEIKAELKENSENCTPPAENKRAHEVYGLN